MAQGSILAGAGNRFFSIGKAFLFGLGECTELTIEAFFTHPYYHTHCRHGRKKDSMRIAVKRLEERGLVVRKANAPHAFLLTPQGKKFLQKLLPFKKQQPVSAQWDKKWRILVFDIPEKRKRERRLLRYELSALGFKKMQKSVWLTPFAPDTSFIDRLNAVGKLGENVEFLVAESISNAEKYKKLFQIS